MKHLRNKRGLAGLGVLATVIGVTLWIVLPALASPAGSPSNSSTSSVPGDYVAPASKTNNVYPQDVAVGGNGTCSNLFNDAYDSSFPPTTELDNSNPKDTNGALVPSGKGDGASFGLHLYTENGPKGTKNEFLDLSSSGARILGVGINGGNDTTVYDYTQVNPGGYKPATPPGVTGDTYLHAPAQSYSGYGTTTNIEQLPVSLYSISHLTICYLPILTVSGTVFNDTNQNGVNDGSTTDPGLPGWTVTLYGGGTTVTTQSSTDSTTLGQYSFSVPFQAGSTYKVCETPPAGTTWVQTEPAPSSASVCDTTGGQLPNGYQVTASGSGFDFGNVEGFYCSDPTTPLGPAYYQIGSCKAGETYVFNSGTIASGTYTGAPYVTYGLGTPTSTTQATIEYVKVADSFTSDPNQPDHKSLYYTNDPTFPAPADPSSLSWKLMPYCNYDPRGTTAATPFDLPSGVNPGDVIPGYTADNSIDACVISITTSRPTTGNGSGTLEAYVYALDDAGRMAF